MTSNNMKRVFAGQLDSLNLDRAGTIERAAEIIANLSQLLVEAEARAANAEIQQQASADQVDFCRRSADESFRCSLLAIEACREYQRVLRAELPAYLDNIAQVAMDVQRKLLAFDNAQRKLANDPKQKAKDEILEKWSDWHLEHPHRYIDNTDFSEAMKKEYEKTLESSDQIKQWCGEWSKEIVFNCWKRWKTDPHSPMTNEEFAACMKQRIKPLKPHIIIGWCEQFEKASNPAS